MSTLGKRSRARRVAAALAITGTLAATVAGGVWAADSFDDVPVTNPFHADIGWMADTGISEGYDDGTYRPAEPVTRQGMSAFLHRQADHVVDVVAPGIASVPAAAVQPFDPVKPFRLSPEGFAWHQGPEGGITCGMAPVDLPQGAALQSLGAHAWDNGTGEVGVTLRAEAVFASDSPLVLAEVFTAGASASVQHPEADVLAPHTVDLEANVYYLEICAADDPESDYRFFGAYVEYELDA